MIWDYRNTQTTGVYHDACTHYAWLNILTLNFVCPFQPLDLLKSYLMSVALRITPLQLPGNHTAGLVWMVTSWNLTMERREILGLATICVIYVYSILSVYLMQIKIQWILHIFHFTF